jgi:hypothetical protein
MTRQEFADFARGLTAYYGRQAMTPDRLNMIYPKVEHVPAEAAKWILNHITDNSDNMPANIGKSVLVGWYDWQRANPGRVIDAKVYHCPDCRHGHIFVQRDGLTAVFRCATCGQATEQGYRLAHQYELLASGWTLQASERAYRPGMQRPPSRIRAWADSPAETARRVRHVPECEQEEVCPF